MDYEAIREGAIAAERRWEKTRLLQVLRQAKWRLGVAAQALEVEPSTLKRAIYRHDDLRAQFNKMSPGRGRPKKNAQ